MFLVELIPDMNPEIVGPDVIYFRVIPPNAILALVEAMFNLTKVPRYRSDPTAPLIMVSPIALKVAPLVPLNAVNMFNVVRTGLGNVSKVPVIVLVVAVTVRTSGVEV